MTELLKPGYPVLSQTYFEMCGGSCRRVMLIDPTYANEYPYKLAEMITCRDPEHNHK